VTANTLYHSPSAQPKTERRIAFLFAFVLVLLIAVSILVATTANAGARLSDLQMQSWIKQLGDDRLTVQRSEAQSALENAGENAVPSLVIALRSQDTITRRNAADMLGYIASPQSVTALSDSLSTEPVPAVRRNVAWALGEIDNLSVMPALSSASVLDRNQLVRQTAADSIARNKTRLALSSGLNEQDLSAFAVAPSRTNTVYLATRRDIILSHDAGKTWQTLSNVLPSQVTTLTVSPTNPLIVYAGVDGLGVYSSTDGGETWNAINKGLGFMPGARYVITAITIDPANPQHIYAAAGVWLGTSQLEFHPLGIMTTTNGGAMWQVLQKVQGNQQITRMALQNNQIYALSGENVLIYQGS
jgi:hypothetical protein